MGLFGDIVSRNERALALRKAQPPRTQPREAPIAGRAPPKPAKKLTPQELEKRRKEEEAERLNKQRDFSALLNTDGSKSRKPSAAPASKPKKVLSCLWCNGKGCRRCPEPASASAKQAVSKPSSAALGKKAAPPAPRMTASAQRGDVTRPGPTASSLHPSSSRQVAPSARKPLASEPPPISRSKPKPDNGSNRPMAPPSSAARLKSSKPQTGKDTTSLKRSLRRLDSYEDDGFIEDDDVDELDWQRALRRATGYDPTKYANERDDPRMVAGWRAVQAEESRSRRLGREADLAAEEEEMRHRQEKERKRMEYAKKKAKISA